MKARILRFLALIFAVVGVIIFAVLYVQNIQGAVLSSLTNPYVITLVIVPFLPAIVLSLRASKLEKDYIKKFKDKK